MLFPMARSLLVCALMHGNATPCGEETMSEQVDSSKTIFDFVDSSEADRWMAINDNVMGGISEGGASRGEDSCLVFSGSLSLENNGGFSSIRSLPDNFEIGDYEGVRIRIKGDGRVYQFRVRTDANFDGVAFKHEFATVDDKWIDIDLPFEAFLPTYRGRILRDVGPLKAADIKQLGLIIADKTSGPFKLMVDEIAVYR